MIIAINFNDPRIAPEFHAFANMIAAGGTLPDTRLDPDDHNVCQKAVEDWNLFRDIIRNRNPSENAKEFIADKIAMSWNAYVKYYPADMYRNSRLSISFPDSISEDNLDWTTCFIVTTAMFNKVVIL